MTFRLHVGFGIKEVGTTGTGYWIARDTASTSFFLLPISHNTHKNLSRCVENDITSKKVASLLQRFGEKDLKYLPNQT